MIGRPGFQPPLASFRRREKSSQNCRQRRIPGLRRPFPRAGCSGDGRSSSMKWLFGRPSSASNAMCRSIARSTSPAFSLARSSLASGTCKWRRTSSEAYEKAVTSSVNSSLSTNSNSARDGKIGNSVLSQPRLRRHSSCHSRSCQAPVSSHGAAQNRRDHEGLLPFLRPPEPAPSPADLRRPLPWSFRASTCIAELHLEGGLSVSSVRLPPPHPGDRRSAFCAICLPRHCNYEITWTLDSAIDPLRR